ncbi:ASST-domain-containing protein [Tricladium varicosporioides]|nr:ASST-domain-containing protein [Hymenoscyphus varicosporioides]
MIASIVFIACILTHIFPSLALGTDAIEDVDAFGWAIQKFNTVPFQPPKFQVSTSGRPISPGYIILTPNSLVGTSTKALITTDTGELIWHSQPAGTNYLFNNLNVQTLRNNQVLTYWNGTKSGLSSELGFGYGHVSILDTSYKEIYRICPKINLVTSNGATYECPLDFHEAFITDRGTLIATVYNVTSTDLTSVGGPKNGYVFDSVFLEIDIPTQKILFRWSPLEAGILVNASHLGISGISGGGTKANPLDWFHMNSIQSVGDGYLVNSRHTWSTYMLDKKGNVKWTLKGDTGGDFALDLKGHFSWQHYAQLSDLTTHSAKLTLFDNHNNFGPFHGTSPSTSLSFQLSFATRSATLLSTLVDANQTIYSDAQGSSSQLQNGNTMLCYGNLPVLKEFGPLGDVHMSLQFGDMNSIYSYRGFRKEWRGAPSGKPDVMVKGNKVYMSWNGATDITQWSIYGRSIDKEGTEMSGGFRILGNLPKSGFETEYTLNRNVTSIMVVASQGQRKLGESAVVTVASRKKDERF